jgi:hypothetical protein
MFDPSILITATLASLALPLIARLVPRVGQKLLDFFFAAQMAELRARFQRQLDDHRLGLQRALEAHKMAMARELAEGLEAVRHEYAKKLGDHQADRQAEREAEAARLRMAAVAAARVHGSIVRALQAMDEAEDGMPAVRSPGFRRMGLLLSRLDHELDEACFDDAGLRQGREAFLAAYDGCDLREQPVRQRIRMTLQRIDGLLRGPLR